MMFAFFLACVTSGEWEMTVQPLVVDEEPTAHWSTYVCQPDISYMGLPKEDGWPVTVQSCTAGACIPFDVSDWHYEEGQVWVTCEEVGAEIRIYWGV
jgi:hypothetical protein